MYKLTVLAGNRTHWEADLAANRGTTDTELCRVQTRQYAQGRREAELVETIFGYGVRIRSGLCENQVLFGGRALGRQVPKEEAIAWGIAWANQDPDKRTFIRWEVA